MVTLAFAFLSTTFFLSSRYQNAAVRVSMGDQEMFFIFILPKVLGAKYERRMIISTTDYNAKHIAVCRFRHGLSREFDERNY